MDWREEGEREKRGGVGFWIDVEGRERKEKGVRRMWEAFGLQGDGGEKET